MQDLAQRLIDHETERLGTADVNTPASFRVCATLQPHLATLMGTTGFRVLLTRALQMARESESSLRSLQVTLEGALEIIVGTKAPSDRRVIAKGSVDLVAQLLTLLAAFIGEDLTRRIVQDAWPKLPAATSVIDKGKSK